MKDLVSVVVPVYNVRPYLDRCLKSLTEQTYCDLEIILVDDGSSDGSGALCDHWAETDPRVRAFHKENGGLSDARNYGLARAAGEFVCFVDSDDWCEGSYIERMHRALVDTASDVAECDYLRTEALEAGSVSRQSEGGYEVYEGRECFHRFLTNVFFVSVCNKLYRRALLENVPFRRGVYHEDEFWTYQIFSRARRVCRVHYTGYYYYQRQGSIVHTKPSHKRLGDAFQAGRERVAFIEAHYPEFASLGYSKMMYTCMYLFSEARRGDFPQRAEMQAQLHKYHCRLLRGYLKKRQYRKEMWRFCLFALVPDCYCRLNAGKGL